MMKGVNFVKKHSVLFSLVMIVLALAVYVIGSILGLEFPLQLSEAELTDVGDISGHALACVFIFILSKYLLGKDFSFQFTKNHFAKGILYISPVFIMLILSIATLLSVRDENGALYLGASTILLIVFSNILTGLYEELLFRGLLTQNLLLNSSKFSLFKTVLFSSLAFSLIHALQHGPIQMINALWGGIFAAAVFIRTKNIWPVVIEHALWDMSIFLLNTEGAHGSITSINAELSLSNSDSIAVLLGGAFLTASYILGPIMAIVGLVLLRKSKHAEIKALWGIHESALATANEA